MNFTNEQKKAIYASSNLTVVSASAGSGKTSVIVERIIQKIIKNKLPRNYLMVTFTNAAVQEIKFRINRKIFDIKKQNNLSNIVVCTIDTLCLELIKKSNLFVNVKTINSFERNDLVLKITENILENNYINIKYQLVDVNYDRYLNEFDTKKMICAMLAWDLFSVNINQSDVFLDQSLKKISNKFKYNYLSTFILTYIKKEIKFILHLLNNIPYQSQENISKINKLNNIINSNNVNEILTGIKKINFSPELEIENLHSINKEKIDFILNICKNIIYKLKSISLEEYNQQDILIYKTFFNLIKNYNNVLSNFKQQNHIMDFADIEKTCLNLLKSNHIKVEQFDELILDESQDINNIQSKILEKISNNIFMVGDYKQSIYGFRGTSPEIFESKKETNGCLNIKLNKNFRSNNSIIKFINKCFKIIMTYNTNSIDYNKDNELEHGSNFDEINENNQKHVDYIVLSCDKNIDKVNFESDFIIKKIKEILNNKTQIWDKNKFRDIILSDICILVRNYKKYSNTIFKFLKSKNIDYKSNSIDDFISCEEVKILIAIMEIIVNATQDIYFFKFIMQSKFDFNIMDILNIKESCCKQNLYYSMKSYIFQNANSISKKCKCAFEYLNKIKLIYKEQSLSNLLFFIINDLKKNDIYNNLNFDKIIYSFNDFCKFEEIISIENFIKYLKYGQKNTIFGDFDHRDALLVTSIHKAKGKEFPICILMGCATNFVNNNNNYVYFHQKFGTIINFKDRRSIFQDAAKLFLEQEKLSEEMRLLYVAMTRAKDYLIITAVTPTRKNKLRELLNIVNTTEVREYIVRKSKSFYDLLLATEDI